VEVVGEFGVAAEKVVAGGVVGSVEVVERAHG